MKPQNSDFNSYIYILYYQVSTVSKIYSCIYMPQHLKHLNINTDKIN